MPASDGRLPDDFRKRGTDACIQLDAQQFAGEHTLSMSAAGVVLIPHAVDVKYIARISLLVEPRYTVYTRPSAEALLSTTQTCCKCPLCKKSHRSGTQWCINGCWTPLTWTAVQNRIQFISTDGDRQARSRELDITFGITLTDLHAKCAALAPTSMSLTFPFAVAGVECVACSSILRPAQRVLTREQRRHTHCYDLQGRARSTRSCGTVAQARERDFSAS